MHLKKKNPDLTRTYPAFTLSEGEVDCLFIGKSCSKFGIILDTINNYPSNIFFFFLKTIAVC